MYDELEACYHLIFENWDASIARQAGVLGPLIESACGKSRVRIMDAACGIGTQAIGLAMRGHAVTGSDLSESAVVRARVETAARHLAIPFHAADLRDVSAVPSGPFDAVVIADNAFAHLLSEDDVRQAAASGERQHTMHLYITRETATGWESSHFSSAFHAVPRAMLTGALEAAGFSALRWMEPSESGYYQPMCWRGAAPIDALQCLVLEPGAAI
jgi:SAM-dependent methyltransferase